MKGGRKQTPPCNRNRTTVCCCVVGLLIANPFKLLGEIRITSATLRIMNTSLQHKDKMGPLNEIVGKNYERNPNRSLESQISLSLLGWH